MRISDWSSDVCSSDLGHAVDITAHDAIAGGAIDGVEADLRRFRRGRHHRHRTGDEGELQIALPEGALRHAGSTSGRAKRFLLTPPAESAAAARLQRSEEHTSELQSLMRISYAVFCLKKKKN